MPIFPLKFKFPLTHVLYFCNVFLMWEITDYIIVSGEELTSTAKLKIPTLECENCSKKSNSFNLLNVSLRRRNIPSPLFDDSVQSMNNSALVLEPIQPIQPLLLPSKTKSLGEELLEVRVGSGFFGILLYDWRICIRGA